MGAGPLQPPVFYSPWRPLLVTVQVKGAPDAAWVLSMGSQLGTMTVGRPGHTEEEWLGILG